MIIYFIILVLILGIGFWLMTKQRDVNYIFDGKINVKIPTQLTSKEQEDEVSFSLLFHSEPEDGIIYAAKSIIDPKQFQILYIQNGEIYYNENNDKLKSFIVERNTGSILKNEWLYFSIVINNELKDFSEIYFGGTNVQIPENIISYDKVKIEPFPKGGLVAIVKKLNLNNVNLL